MTIDAPPRIGPKAAAGGKPVPHGHARGVLLVIAAALCWSTGGVIVRSLEKADIWTTVFWRGLSAASFLLVLIAVRERAGTLAAFRRIGWPGLLVAFCFAVNSTAIVMAFNLTSVANTLVILSSAPLIAAVLAWILLGERVRPVSWLALAASMGGIALMVSESKASGSWTGDLFAAVVAFGSAVAGVVIRRHREIQMAPAICLGTLATSIVATPLATPAAVTARDMLLLFVFGAGQLGLGLALFTFGAPLIPAAEAALLSVLEPLLGPLWVWLVHGEAPTRGALIGGGIVLVALAVHLIADARLRRA